MTHNETRDPMSPCLIIAEAGVNHNGRIEQALELVDAAAEAGADRVKFQTFRADRLATAQATKARYQQQTTDAAQSQRDMLRALELSKGEFRRLWGHCEDRGIGFLSSPFDLESLDFLVDELEVDLLKLGSGELTNGPLLLAAARSGRPLILSTGMADLAEVRDALALLAFGYTRLQGDPTPAACQAALASPGGQDPVREKLTLLHCLTQYPAPLEQVNLRAMDTLAETFALPVGYSDHTLGQAISLAAVARGAVVIEKHLTLDRGLPGPDHHASLEPGAFAELVAGIRAVEAALGDGDKRPAPAERENRPIARKSLVALYPIARGEILNRDNLGVLRPGHGISPMDYWGWLGKTAQRDYGAGELIEP